MFPEENTTILLRENRRQQIPGRNAFIAQVCGSFPVVPNLVPAMKTTFGASGRRATWSSSRRSQERGSTPAIVIFEMACFSEKRETAITRRREPARSEARRRQARHHSPQPDSVTPDMP